MKDSLRLADVLEEIGSRLQRRFGDAPIPQSEIRELVVRETGFSGASVILADFSYNRINRDSDSHRHLLFVQESPGHYRFVGRNYPYTGKIFWKPYGKPERAVGEMIEGHEGLLEDPRG